MSWGARGCLAIVILAAVGCGRRPTPATDSGSIDADPESSIIDAGSPESSPPDALPIDAGVMDAADANDEEAPIEPCDPLEFVGHCEDNVLVGCSSEGAVRRRACAPPNPFCHAFSEWAPGEAHAVCTAGPIGDCTPGCDGPDVERGCERRASGEAYVQRRVCPPHQTCYQLSFNPFGRCNDRPMGTCTAPGQFCTADGRGKFSCDGSVIFERFSCEPGERCYVGGISPGVAVCDRADLPTCDPLLGPQATCIDSVTERICTSWGVFRSSPCAPGHACDPILDRCL